MQEGVADGDAGYKIAAWIAADDEDTEGIFRDWYSDQLIQYLPFPPNRPYKGGTKYNYLRANVVAIVNNTNIVIVRADVGDEQATTLGVPVCTVVSKVLKLRLRGLCTDFPLDREYFYFLTEMGHQVYKGRTTTTIYFDRELKLWLFQDQKDNSTLISSTSDRESFLLGLHQVSFQEAKESKCFQDKIFQPIKFTSCTAGFFTCNDGSCILMNKRCDQTAHCDDGSDEKNCKLIVMEGNYNKNIAPFIVDPDNDQVQPVQVNISAEILDILKINEVEETFKLKFQLALSWYDFRLIYHNLKESRIANSPSLEEVQKLWIPSIIFGNTENNDVIASDPLAKVTISKEGVFDLSSETVVDEINIFKGSENKITFDKVYTKTLKCIYKLQLYPFDTQECTVNLEVGRYERKIITILPKSIQMMSETLLSQHFITGWQLDFINRGQLLFYNFSDYNHFQYLDHPKEGVHIKIILKRRINNAVLTIYLPTFLILSIVYATNFFKDYFFEAAVTVNLTSLLVLTTLFISVSQSLPPTAYVKMIDIWLIFVQLVPFAEVLLNTWMDVLRVSETREINHHGKTVTVGDTMDDEVRWGREFSLLVLHTIHFSLFGISNCPSKIGEVDS